MNISDTFLTRYLSAVFTLSIIVAVLMTALSLAGLLLPLETYPNEELRQSFVANDVVNLVIDLPALLGALWLLRRAKLPGLLGLPGALFYATYNSIAYAAAMPLTWSFFVHLGLAILSGAAIFLVGTMIFILVQPRQSLDISCDFLQDCCAVDISLFQALNAPF
jgi:hypothetical protein